VAKQAITANPGHAGEAARLPDAFLGVAEFALTV
jgi:hypothetical protein